VRENLDPHGRFSDMELWRCLATVQLKELIASLPDKLGNIVGIFVINKVTPATFIFSLLLLFVFCYHGKIFHLDTCFNEGEALLSFGQRQLFCLARAVLKDSICLLLDEATSNLDYGTEVLFLKAANDAFKGKTVITIAVRFHCNILLAI
jgi:ABC-type multidrug transport system fused ATPase/permease subunit